MNDLYHYWGSDLQRGNTGDLMPVSSTERGQQRIIRRLLTNPGDYIFQPDYGAGLPAYIGQTVDMGKILSLIRSQISLEDCVAQTPAPEITIKQLPTELSGFTVTIAYNDAVTNTPQILSFNVTR
jgi:phage baseplate assembly protein W